MWFGVLVNMNYKHTLLFLLLLVVSVSPVVAANSPMAFYYSNLTTIPQPVTGAAGMWLFNEGQGDIINDVSGNSNDGVVNGTVTWDSSGMITGTTGYVNLSNPAGLDIGANPMTQVLFYSPYLNNTYNTPFGDSGAGTGLYQDYLLKLSLNQIQLYYNPAGIYRAITGEKTIISGAPNAIIGVTPNLTLFSISNLTSTYTNTVGGSTRVHAYTPRYIGYGAHYGIARGTYHGTILYPFPLTDAQTTQLQKWANWYYDTRDVRFVQTPKAPMYEAGSGPLAVSFTDSSSKSTASRVWNITPLGGSPTTFSTAANPEYLFWNGNYTVSLTVSNSGGIANTMSTWINVSGAYEPLPPNSITGLTNTTENCSNVTWSWTNPTDADYSYLYALKNDVWIGNYANSTSSATWTGLYPLTSYTISTKTVNLDGMTNATWVNATTITTNTGCIARPTMQTINHTLGSVPSYVLVTITKPGELSSVSNLTASSFDLTITNAVTGLAGTPQTIYYCVGS
jgi:hypothetical protein